MNIHEAAVTLGKSRRRQLSESKLNYTQMDVRVGDERELILSNLSRDTLRWKRGTVREYRERE